METTQKDFYDETYVFDNEMGLNFAVAFTALDFDDKPTLPESHGSLVFHLQEHSLTADG